MKINSEEISSIILAAWFIWVSGVCALITFVFGKQRKAVDAAFNKIRVLENKNKADPE